eukprot:784197_1
MIEIDDDEKKEAESLPLSIALKYQFVTPWTSMIVVKKTDDKIIAKPVISDQPSQETIEKAPQMIRSIKYKYDNKSSRSQSTSASGVRSRMSSLDKVQAMKKRVESTIAGRIKDVT